MADEDEAKRRRAAQHAHWQEEEAWEALEEERILEAQEQRKLEDDAAVEEMAEWFFQNFEDPQNQTPLDGESKEYLYIWGGPFEASDVLHSQFGEAYSEGLIGRAVERVEGDGTVEWAPSPGGDFYDHGEEPELDGGLEEEPRFAISERILSHLDVLEAQIAELEQAPPAFGHNYPPDDIGVPPYDQESIEEIREAALVTRVEVREDVPDEEKLRAAQTTFARVAKGIMLWVGKKLDLAVDEAIKEGVKASVSIVKWNLIGATLLALAKELHHFLLH